MNRARKRQRIFLMSLRSYPRSSVCLVFGCCLLASVIIFTTSSITLDRVLGFSSSSTNSDDANSPKVKRVLPDEKNENAPRVNNGLSPYDQNIEYKDFNYLKPETLTFEKRIYGNNIEVHFRLPKKVPIQALLLIFHGCGRSAHDWFHTVERQRIIGAAIDLGYGCIAFDATDISTCCWSNVVELAENPDVQMVIRALQGFYGEFSNLASLPRFIIGSSSGGIFSSIFVTNEQYPIQGQILIVSIILPEVLVNRVRQKNYPPTAWIYMSRDTEFASKQRIDASIHIFDREGIPCTTFEIQPISLKRTTFHDRIPTITEDTSNYIFYSLQKNNWLDSYGYLLYNPRRKNAWETFLFESTKETVVMKAILKNLKHHMKALKDFLNTVFGEHEISFERSYEALKWQKDLYFSKINATK